MSLYMTYTESGKLKDGLLYVYLPSKKQSSDCVLGVIVLIL